MGKRSIIISAKWHLGKYFRISYRLLMRYLYCINAYFHIFLLKINLSWMFTKVFPIHPSLVCQYFCSFSHSFCECGFPARIFFTKILPQRAPSGCLFYITNILKSIINRLGTSIAIGELLMLTLTLTLKLKSEIFLAMWITSLYERTDAKMLTLTCKDMTKI